MKTYTTPIEMKATKSYCFGSFPKTYISGNAGDVFTVIAETKAYYITTNPKNNKLPKWVIQ
jgi:hypothetical protein